VKLYQKNTFGKPKLLQPGIFQEARGKKNLSAAHRKKTDCKEAKSDKYLREI